MPHRYSDLWRSVAQALLGAPEFTPAEVAAEAGVDLQQARRLWRALGFPAVPDDDRVFTRTDVAMLRAAAGLLEQEVAEPEVLLQLTRVTGQALARVAEAQVAAAADRLGDLLRAADTAEYVDENNTSKWCRLSRESFAVGALARFNNNHRFLHPKARKVASGLGLEAVCHNPFMNNVAQLVECVHATHDAIRLIEELVEDGPAETMAPVRPKSGQGAGAVEVPPRDSLPPL